MFLLVTTLLLGSSGGGSGLIVNNRSGFSAWDTQLRRPHPFCIELLGIPTFCNKANKQAKHHADHQLFQNSPKPIRSLAAELMTKEETYVPREDKQRIPQYWRLLDSSISSSPRQLRPPLPSLHNPLLRQQRLGCGWLGVIIEWEGVIVEVDSKLEKQAWLIYIEKNRGNEE